MQRKNKVWPISAKPEKERGCPVQVAWHQPPDDPGKAEDDPFTAAPLQAVNISLCSDFVVDMCMPLLILFAESLQGFEHSC